MISGDALHRVEPVIGVEDHPAHRAGAPAVRPELHVEHVANPIDLSPRKEIDIVRPRWIFRLKLDAGRYVANMILAHERHRLWP